MGGCTVEIGQTDHCMWGDPITGEDWWHRHERIHPKQDKGERSVLNTLQRSWDKAAE